MPANPFYNGSLASNGVTYAVPSGGKSSLVSGVKDLVSLMGQGDERAVNRAHAAYYQSEAEKNAAEISRQQTKDARTQDATARYHSAVNMANKDPSKIRAATQALQEDLAAYYMDNHGVEGARGLQQDQAVLDIAGQNQEKPTPGTAFSRDVLSGLMAASGHALGDNQALTASENAGRFNRKQSDVEQKTQFEHGDRRYNTDVDAATSRRGQDVSAGTSRANNRDDIAARASEGQKDRTKTTTTHTYVEKSGAPTTTTSVNRNAKGEVTGSKVTTKGRSGAAAPGPATIKTRSGATYKVTPIG